MAAARLVAEILARTITGTSLNGRSEADAELVFGAASPMTDRHLRLRLDESQLQIGADVPATVLWREAPDMLLLLAACYATGRVLRLTLGDRLRLSGLPLDQTFVVSHDALLGEDRSWLSRQIQLEHTYVAGAGAIGNGFAYALRFLNLSGDLVFVDPDTVSDGNLNRCLLFTKEDLEAPKATRLAERMAPTAPGLRVKGEVKTLQQLAKSQSGPAWLRRLIVGVDSPRVRRHLQGEIPGEMFDASTTGVQEIVLHHHKQPTEEACLSCIYRETETELARERHIAESLGVSIDDVKQHHVSVQAAEKIRKQYPQLEEGALVGTPYDTLFKALCGEVKLMTPEGKQVLAPFAFVSVLAGALLAVEMARRLVLGPAAATFNYWRLSPWHPPVLEMRATRPRHAACEFCSVPVLVRTARSLWGSSQQQLPPGS
jgi:hypothetical protein